MFTAKEYIFLSVLSYCNFGEEEYGKNLYDIFKSDKVNKIVVSTFDILNLNYKDLLFDYFGDILHEWKVFYVDNRTASIKNSQGSGFYAVVFEKNDKYVVAYRGSEKYPIEDAYKDFIETDLVIGLGKIPLQFYEGVEVYNTLLDKFEIKKEDITITGHSLGGGIAQYVALSLDKNMDYIPYVYTWNAVGINREGIVSLFEFIDLDEILKENTDLSDNELKNLAPFKESYINFLSKELKKAGTIKDNITLLDKNKEIVIDENFIKRLLKNTNIESCLMKFQLQRRKDLLLNQNLFKVLFQFDKMPLLLRKAQKLIDKIKENKAYEDRVNNFGHSQDLTNSLFRHIGSSYLVDKNFSKRTFQHFSFFYNLKLFGKSIQDLHFEDVFLAFISNEKENSGNFNTDLNLDFLASCSRKMITAEYCLTTEFLAKYYSLEMVDIDNFLELRNTLVKGFENCGLDLLYKEKIVEQIKNMNAQKFSILWEKLKFKLPSPYKYLDIFDIFIFKKNK